MKVSGMTIARNIVRLDYPFVESIRSILPIVDEFVVNLGKSDDGTVERIRSIGDPKIRWIETDWAESESLGAELLSIQTNVGLKHCTGDLVFYLQGDEVIHEDDLPVIRKKMAEAFGNPGILGLAFRYLHFCGDYWTVDPWGYHREVRIIRNDGSVRSVGDARTFARVSDGRWFNRKMLGKEIRLTGARVFHYGHVMGREKRAKKYQETENIWQGRLQSRDEKPWWQSRMEEIDLRHAIGRSYRGSHPGVMAERIREAGGPLPRVNRWLNWRFYREVLRHGFHG